MICPQCAGNGFVQIPSMQESDQSPFEINCPTCEGQGELSDVPVLNHCPACGDPLKDGQVWCDDHRAAGLLEVPTYPALCVICSGKGFNEIREYSYASLKFETKQVPCTNCDGQGHDAS
jgi:DnaJ-class molecular chaperone